MGGLVLQRQTEEKLSLALNEKKIASSLGIYNHKLALSWANIYITHEPKIQTKHLTEIVLGLVMLHLKNPVSNNSPGKIQ